jgi:xylulokinase
MDTGRSDMIQAVLEGVAFAIRDSLEVARSLGLDLKKSRICGGGAKSPLWREIMANVCGLELEQIESEEGPGYGGAMLAAVACGEYKSVAEAAEKLVRVTGTVKPDPEISARYEAQYRKFARIYPALKEVFPVLNG